MAQSTAPELRAPAAAAPPLRGRHPQRGPPAGTWGTVGCARVGPDGCCSNAVKGIGGDDAGCCEVGAEVEAEDGSAAVAAEMEGGTELGGGSTAGGMMRPAILLWPKLVGLCVADMGQHHAWRRSICLTCDRS